MQHGLRTHPRDPSTPRPSSSRDRVRRGAPLRIAHSIRFRRISEGQERVKKLANGSFALPGFNKLRTHKSGVSQFLHMFLSLIYPDGWPAHSNTVPLEWSASHYRGNRKHLIIGSEAT